MNVEGARCHHLSSIAAYRRTGPTRDAFSDGPPDNRPHLIQWPESVRQRVGDEFFRPAKSEPPQPSSRVREIRVEQLLRVQNFNVSSDGIAAGEDQSLECPFGLDPGEMLAWAGATASWPMRTDPGGSLGLDDYFTRDFARNIGAEIMGRNKFSPHRGPWNDHEWRGWWGDEPPFHTPVFVMTHHERPSFTLADTTFHFVDGDPATILEQARQAAEGKDVRLGGGVTTIRQFLDADLVDTMHVAVSPVKFGSGLRLWESPDELRDRFHLEIVPSPSGVTHHLFWRK
ncbi:dihydrofolate reductase [Rhodococcus sp. BE178]